MEAHHSEAAVEAHHTEPAAGDSMQQGHHMSSLLRIVSSRIIYLWRHIRSSRRNLTLGDIVSAG